MRTVALRTPIALGPTDSIELTLKLELVNDTDRSQLISAVLWKPVIESVPASAARARLSGEPDDEADDQQDRADDVEQADPEEPAEQ
jgi:hypothetical protein